MWNAYRPVCSANAPAHQSTMMRGLMRQASAPALSSLRNPSLAGSPMSLHPPRLSSLQPPGQILPPQHQLLSPWPLRRVLQHWSQSMPSPSLLRDWAQKSPCHSRQASRPLPLQHGLHLSLPLPLHPSAPPWVWGTHVWAVSQVLQRAWPGSCVAPRASPGLCAAVLSSPTEPWGPLQGHRCTSLSQPYWPPLHLALSSPVRGRHTNQEKGQKISLKFHGNRGKGRLATSLALHSRLSTWLELAAPPQPPLHPAQNSRRF